MKNLSKPVSYLSALILMLAFVSCEQQVIVPSDTPIANDQIEYDINIVYDKVIYNGVSYPYEAFFASEENADILDNIAEVVTPMTPEKYKEVAERSEFEGDFEQKIDVYLFEDEVAAEQFVAKNAEAIDHVFKAEDALRAENQYWEMEYAIFYDSSNANSNPKWRTSKFRGRNNRNYVFNTLGSWNDRIASFRAFFPQLSYNSVNRRKSPGYMRFYQDTNKRGPGIEFENFYDGCGGKTPKAFIRINKLNLRNWHDRASSIRFGDGQDNIGRCTHRKERQF